MGNRVLISTMVVAADPPTSHSPAIPVLFPRPFQLRPVMYHLLLD